MTLIAQISDLHLRPRGVPALRLAETNMLAERAVDALLALRPRPDAVVITGDIVDGKSEAEYRLARWLLGRLPMPVYLLSGNHDDSTLMKQIFAGADWVSQGSEDRVFYAVDIGEVRLVALDSSVPGAPHGELSAEQLEFLDFELSVASDRPAMVAIHHPPFATGIPAMDRSGLLNPEALAATLAQHKNVARLLCGHVHRPIMTMFGGTLAAIAPSVCHQIELTLEDKSRFGFNFEPPAYYLHRWTEGGMVTHLAYVERFAGPYPFSPDESVRWTYPV